MQILDRRHFLRTAGFAVTGGPVALAGGSAEGSFGLGSAPGQERPASGPGLAFPSTDPDLVSTMVRVAHVDLDAVKTLLETRPHLSRAAVDWGFGDWESALGAASHMGRRDIAQLLLDAGARPNIFSAAMLGQLDVVRAFVDAQPGIQSTLGPHGITLMAHARAGAEQASAVVAYLETVGGADVTPDTIATTKMERAAFVGRYRFEAERNAHVDIEEVNGALSLKRAGAAFGRRLFSVSERVFFPSGAPTVRIVFELQDGRAVRVRVIDHVELLVAARE